MYRVKYGILLICLCLPAYGSEYKVIQSSDTTQELQTTLTLAEMYGMSRELYRSLSGAALEVEQHIVETLVEWYSNAFTHMVIPHADRSLLINKDAMVNVGHTRNLALMREGQDVVFTYPVFDLEHNIGGPEQYDYLAIYSDDDHSARQFSLPEGLFDCAVSPDESYIVASSNPISIFDSHVQLIKNLDPRIEFDGQVNGQRADDHEYLQNEIIQFFDGGRKIMTARLGANDCVRLWDIQTGRCYKEHMFSEIYGAAINEEGTRLAVIYSLPVGVGSLLFLFDTTGREFMLIQRYAFGRGIRVCDMQAFLRFLDATTVLVALNEGVACWNLTENEITQFYHKDRLRVSSLSTTPALRDLWRSSTRRPYNNRLTSLHVIPEKRMFMTTSMGEVEGKQVLRGSAALWDLETGKKLVTYEDSNPMVAGVFSPEHKKVVTMVADQAYALEGRSFGMPILKFWHWLLPPQNCIKGRLTIGQALLIIFLHDVTRVASSARNVHYPAQLKEEMIEIFRSLEPEMREYLRFKYFA